MLKGCILTLGCRQNIYYSFRTHSGEQKSQKFLQVQETFRSLIRNSGPESNYDIIKQKNSNPNLQVFKSMPMETHDYKWKTGIKSVIILPFRKFVSMLLAKCLFVNYSFN